MAELTYGAAMALVPDTAGVRLAELVATASYAADLGLGQPMEHCMRQMMIALRMADLAGADEHDREATYYVGLLMNVYCHVDAVEQTQWFGDDISFKGDGVETLGMNTAQTISFFLRRAASHGNALHRARRLATFPVAGQKQLVEFVRTHSTLAAQFASRIGFDHTVCDAVAQCYEQWDGSGQPHQLRGTAICLPTRLAQLASPVEVFSRRHGVDAAVRLARRHRGTLFDPDVADLFCAHAAQLLDGLDQAAGWDAIMDAEPRLHRHVAGAQLDQVLEAMADLVDVKSPCLAGHSRGVANLAAEAARVLGMGDDEVDTVRRAGLVHDLGRVGVSNAIWDKAGSLTESERERVRLHPYLTERMLARVTGLSGSREIAVRHHERLDGSGYPHGLTAASLTPSDRLLAAADVYHATTEPRPYRPPLDAEAAGHALRVEVRAGRLDGEVANAVLRAAGHRAPTRRAWPGGLTTREVEILRTARPRPREQADRQAPRRRDEDRVQPR